MKVFCLALTLFLVSETIGSAKAKLGAQQAKHSERQLVGCSVASPEWVGDGYCDHEGGYNTKECNWDGGDCCDATCIAAAFQCGVNGLDCQNPDTRYPDTRFSPTIEQGHATTYDGLLQVKTESACNGNVAQCSAQPYDTSANLAHPSNGALPAVAKDTIRGYSGIHQPSYLNDGKYGNGASWISNSMHSWLKVDLGGCRGAIIRSVKFGRDRLGHFDDRDPGQIKLYVAESDNVYADGDDTFDNSEYTLVLDSSGTGFSGVIDGGETLEARFNPVIGRFVKIEVQNAGACIDEIEIFGSIIDC